MKKNDITEKLELCGNTVLVIKQEELEVKTDAKTAIILMGKVADGKITNKNMNEVCELLFTSESKEKLENMNLSFKDYATVIRSAIDAVTGEGDSGEDRTRTTT